MKKLEDHTPLFVRVPTALFDAAQAEAKERRVVLRVVITDALEAWFGLGVVVAEIEPSPPLASPPAPAKLLREAIEARNAALDTDQKTRHLS